MSYQIEQPELHSGHHLLDKGQDETKSVFHVAKAVGADFHVDYLESGYFDPERGGYHVPRIQGGKNRGVARSFHVVRRDTRQELGHHSNRYAKTDAYHPVFETVERLFPHSTESITMFGEGQRIVICQNLGEPIDLGQGEEIKPMLYWTSSLDGRWKTAVYDVMNRLFCQNQLINKKPIMAVKHTVNHNDMLKVRSMIMMGYLERAETFKNMAKVMKDQSYTDQEFEQLVQTIVPIDWADDAERKIDRLSSERAGMYATWRSETEGWGSGNRWLAYNAVQGAEQHRINTRVRGQGRNASRSLAMAIEGKTPYADKALAILQED